MNDLAPSEMERWRAVRHAQRVANARRWLADVNESDNPAALVIQEYDNFLRALEATLEEVDSFALTFELVEAIFPLVFGFSDNERWLAYLDRALLNSEGAAMPWARARLLELKADLQTELGETELSETLYLQSEALFAEQNDEVACARSLVKRADLLARRGQLEIALSLLNQTLERVTSLGDAALGAQIQLSLARWHYQKGDVDTAIDASRAAYYHYKESGNTAFEVKALGNLVALNVAANRPSEVRRWSDELSQALEVQGDQRAQIKLLINLGIAHFQQEEHLAAERLWQRALSLQSQIGEPTLLVELCNNLGMAYTRLGHYEDAISHLQRALDVNAPLGNAFRQANVHDNLAIALEAQGNREAAVAQLTKGIGLLSGAADDAQSQQLLRDMRLRRKTLI